MSDLPRLRLLSSRETADVLQTHPGTLARWREAGLLKTWMTPGGHRRYSADQVQALRAAQEGSLTVEEAAERMQIDAALLERAISLYRGRVALASGLRVGVDLLTTAQAAAVVGRDSRTIRSWMRQGALSPVGRDGRKVLFRAQDVRALAGGDGVDTLLEAGQAAALAGVGRRTVARWANSGQLSCVVSPGGQRRYRESEVRALLAGGAGR